MIMDDNDSCVLVEVVMVDFRADDLLDPAGRLAYSRLLQAVKTVHKSIFVAQFNHPLLVGQTLYAGEFRDSGSNSSTMRFSFDDIQLATSKPGVVDDSSDLHRSIYPLIKRRAATSLPNMYTIGRIAKNDLVMMDHTLSREHAQIRTHYGKYFLTDLGSTNGSTVSARTLVPHKELEITAGSELGFGRFVFKFVSADHVYDSISSKV